MNVHDHLPRTQGRNKEATMLRARSLTADELAFTWEEQDLAGEGLAQDIREVLSGVRLEDNYQQQAFALDRRRIGVAPRRSPAPLPFSSYRVGNCAITKAFRQRLNAPCLAVPTLKDWRVLLSGRRLGFIGDSVLRDLFVYLCLVLSPLYRAGSAFGIQKTHFGSETEGWSFATSRFGNIELRWCNVSVRAHHSTPFARSHQRYSSRVCSTTTIHV